MSYLLDTNIISELVKSQPSEKVTAWIKAVPSDTMHLSVLSIGEIRKGIEKMQHSSKKEKLKIWLEHELPNWFNDRLMSIDVNVAERWGRLLGEAGRSMPAIDSLLAATALHHDLALVTRNTKDFDFPGLELINPWNT